MVPRADAVAWDDRRVTTGQLTLCYTAQEVLATSFKFSDSRRCVRGGLLALKVEYKTEKKAIFLRFVGMF
jgi:hypothetical protein